MEDLLGSLDQYIPLIRLIVIAIIILFIGWILSKWGNRLTLKSFRKRGLDEALGRFIASLVQYTILAATIITALGTVGLQTTSLIAIFASAGLAIGLALQGSLSNFASGIMILFFRPFNLGDKVSTGGHTGKVADIGIFTTVLITPNNERIIVPNKTVTSDSIVNYTVEGTLRGAIDVGVAYGSDIEQVREILAKAAQSADLVLQDPASSAAFVGLGASSLDFKVFAWSATGDFVPMLHNVRNKVYDALNEAGIEIPFDQLVLHKAPVE